MVSKPDEPLTTSELREHMKTMRDPSKTAYDCLSNGMMIGTFANERACKRYAHKVEAKRERARETRRRKRKRASFSQRAKQKESGVQKEKSRPGPAPRLVDVTQP
jgi:hypothetical protein